jgi:hypothetical protein
MARQTLSVVGLTADDVEDVLAVSPFPEQLQYVNPVAWYVARSAYQNVWRPVGLASEDGAVVGFATTGEVIEDELVMVPGRT